MEFRPSATEREGASDLVAGAQEQFVIIVNCGELLAGDFSKFAVFGPFEDQDSAEEIIEALSEQGLFIGWKHLISAPYMSPEELLRNIKGIKEEDSEI